MEASFVKDFKDIDQIGIGGYGLVFKAKQIDKTFAIKQVKFIEMVKHEVKVWESLYHINTVHYHYCDGQVDPENSLSNSSSKRCLFIYIEFCAEGTLHKRIKKPDKDLALALSEWITNGVACIHSKQLIHRDLKPSKTFSVKNKTKIGDFGLVTSLINHKTQTTQKRTWLYMSPEQVSFEYGNEYGNEELALGLILAELLHISSTVQETIKIFHYLRRGVFPDT
ncbi:LOW QUALITY PROTEIN: interferon-induced, double-stranded RNA-activated protein kinase [Rhynchocyon petersi]